MDFATDHLIPLVDIGLGNSAYLVDLGDGRALAVDASRDLRALRAAAATRTLSVAFAADTHLHADFLSGALQLARDDGATVLASAAGGRAFEHRGLRDGDEVDLGGLTLRALSTPGHTDEHLSFLLLDGTREVGVFTGGSLIVGAAARTDLMGADRTVELARAQFRSLRRLATLPASTAVWPTHGAGSFCSAPPGARRTSTIGAELASNPLLAAADEDTFATMMTAGLGSYPRYFGRMAAINKRGPALVPATLELPALTAAGTRALVADGALIVDVRPAQAFAAGHIPGALSIPLRDAFATWLGWLVPADVPLVLLAGRDTDLEDAAWQAAKIGYDRIAGYLRGGMAAWTDAGGERRSIERLSADRIADRRVLDVRQADEHRAGHIPGAVPIELGELAARVGQAPPGAVVACAHGERAMTAASLLLRAGRTDLTVLAGGPDDWAKATGRVLHHA